MGDNWGDEPGFSLVCVEPGFAHGMVLSMIAKGIVTTIKGVALNLSRKATLVETCNVDDHYSCAKEVLYATTYLRSPVLSLLDQDQGGFRTLPRLSVSMKV